MPGFIQLNRDPLRELLNSFPIGGRHRTRANITTVMVHLLLRAAPSPTVIGGQQLERGQCVIGVDELALIAGLTTQATKTALGRLQHAGVISTVTSRRGTVVTICEFDTLVQKPRQTMENKEADSPPSRSQTNDLEHSTVNSGTTNETAFLSKPTAVRPSANDWAWRTEGLKREN